MDEDVLSARVDDGVDGIISTAKVETENPVGAGHGKCNDTLINPLLNTGIVAVVAGRGHARANWSNVYSCSWKWLKGDIKILVAGNRSNIDLYVAGRSCPGAIAVE